MALSSVHQSPLKHWAQMSPDCFALQTHSKRYTWFELEREVQRYAYAMQQQGVKTQDVVTCVGKNSAELVLIYLACLELGAICAITMPQPQQSLEHKLATLYRNEDTVWCWSAESLDLNHIPNGVVPLKFESLPSPSEFEASVYQSEQLASIIFTSGSTGLPKAVAHTNQQHLASANGLLQGFAFTQQDTWLLSLPMYHVSGLAIIYRWLSVGAQLKVGGGDLLQDIAGVTHASLVATQLSRLLASPQPLSLSHVLLGGSHVALSLSQQAAQRGIETWLGYGMTEAASTVTAKQIDGEYSAGKVLANRALEVRDGHIYVGGETLASGYYTQGDLTPLLDEQGWFATKDLGYWLDNGELVIQGRADNLFISGGENIHCEEIEQAINAHPKVQQSMVIAVENAQYGARPIAFVVSEQPIESLDLPAWLDSRLERFKHPDDYLEMPAELLSGGIKISRRELKQWVTAHSNYTVI